MPTASEMRPAPMAGTDSDRFEAVGLTCIRHDRTLFSDLNFALLPGQLLQVEGANGSGKTSLLRMLCGMLLPVAGEVRWCGVDVLSNRSEFLAQVAYVGHAPGIKDELTPVENLRMARALGRPTAGIGIEDALARVGLYGFEDVPARTLSAGQRRRVALARLLLVESRLWILDEPFTALDKLGRELIETMLEEHSRRGGMAVFTTHHPVNLPHCPMMELSIAA